MVDDSKERASVRHHRTDARVATETVAARTGLQRFKPGSVPPLAGEVGIGVPPLTMNLVAIDTCSERENLFSPIGSMSRSR